MTITIKTAQDIEGMRVACRLASEVLDYIEPFIKPGITTNEIDKLCHDYMVDVQGCIPAPLNYAGRLQALPQVDLHLDQPPGLPRHSKRQAAQKRRLTEHRHHHHQRWLAWRHQPHVPCG